MTETLTRTIDEITASAKMNMQDMIHRAIALGKDFIDAKEQLGHGGFLPWLKNLGVSSSTAANYMKVAKEITPGSRLAELPYSKALALLSAPADQREELAEEAEDKSAAEIKKLIEERNKAAEAANILTAENQRLDEERIRSAMIANKEMARADSLKNELNKMNQYSAELRDQLEKTKADLLTAENNRVEVEVVPADYDQLKKNQAILMNAATEAEERAADLEAELEALRSGEVKLSTYETLHRCVKVFMIDCELMPMKAKDLYKDSNSIIRELDRMKQWIHVMEQAVGSALEVNEGAVTVS